LIENLKELCNLPGVSGNEHKVREYILNKVSSHVDCSVDAMGNIICFKKGKMPSNQKLMVDAHMDEVGLIITSVTDEGYLKFATVGGIETAVLMTRRVIIGEGEMGVISCKPYHLVEADERKKMPEKDSLFIDIGAKSRDQALEKVKLGDVAVFDSEYMPLGELIKAKAIDDRAGCAILIKLLCEDSEYDFYATFSVQEEVGLRGAKAAAFTVNPDSAIVLESTTAADIAGVSDDRMVCKVGCGVAVSFMDGATLYDKGYYDLAIQVAEKLQIPCQSKAAVTGGNNAGAINSSRGGVRTVSLSVPCRYIHSPSCVASVEDVNSVYLLAKAMIAKICEQTARP